MAKEINRSSCTKPISPQLVGHVNIYDNPTFHPNPLDPNPYQVHRYRLYRIHIAPRLSSLSNFIANWILNSRQSRLKANGGLLSLFGSITPHPQHASHPVILGQLAKRKEKESQKA